MTVCRPGPDPLDIHIVMPLRPDVGAKSRLVPPPGVERLLLAAAMAWDTLAAATEAATQRGWPAPVAVGSPREWLQVEADMDGRGVVRFAADPQAGLDAAVLNGAASVPPDSAVLVVVGDLPCLRAEDLQETVCRCARHPTAFVPDRAGTGTTVLWARRSADLRPSFGSGSAARHARWARPVTDAPTAVRLDVDTATDLRLARETGVGAATDRVLERRMSSRAAWDRW